MQDNYKNATTAEEIFQELLNGNIRFVTDNSTNKNFREQLFSTRDIAKPKAIIITDIDSSLAVENAFDRALGELVVFRTPGGKINQDIKDVIKLIKNDENTPLVINLGVDNSACIANKLNINSLKNLTNSNEHKEIFEVNTKELASINIEIKNLIYRTSTGMMERS